jgi:alkylation response protein AidB-like acyl-CoA dehydrogenase
MKNPIADYQQLRERVAQLETDIQESRQLSQRLAEVTDVLAEVLLPAEQRDEARLADLLAKYDKAI